MFSSIPWIYRLFPFNSFTYVFISVVPSVWHILVRVCYDAEFLPCFIQLDSTDSPTSSMAAVSDGRNFRNVPIVLPVCPPLYLMFILWVLGVKIRYVICLFVFMSAVTGRTHVNWRYRTLSLGVIRQCGVCLGLLLRSLIRISLFALQTQICLLLMN